ncbi:hypothetical protein MRB53_031270 [Persea americana]|uniref:Uncharacterized protein n=1 Tax=Persea americana TaxID=3435 RepID=A0ACC2KNN9_PERAE|nr:hypothetical protein MRB53_031270 [Persea americana]
MNSWVYSSIRIVGVIEPKEMPNFMHCNSLDVEELIRGGVNSPPLISIKMYHSHRSQIGDCLPFRKSTRDDGAEVSHVHDLDTIEEPIGEVGVGRGPSFGILEKAIVRDGVEKGRTQMAPLATLFIYNVCNSASRNHHPFCSGSIQLATDIEMEVVLV